MSKPDHRGVTPLHPCADLPTALRNLADNIEAGLYGGTDECTVVFPGGSEVFHMGTPANDIHAGTSAMFNMQCGIARMANAVITGGQGDG